MVLMVKAHSLEMKSHDNKMDLYYLRPTIFFTKFEASSTHIDVTHGLIDDRNLIDVPDHTQFVVKNEYRIYISLSAIFLLNLKQAPSTYCTVGCCPWVDVHKPHHTQLTVHSIIILLLTQEIDNRQR